MTQVKKTKENIINETFDKHIKNLEPTFRNELYNKLFERTDISSCTKCTSVISSMMNLRSKGMGSKQYWLIRGWDELHAEIKAKENMKSINARANRNSPFSRMFWTKKINPATGINYTVEEADYERNSRRPIREEYWIKRGSSPEEAARLATERKNKNNKLGAIGSKNRSPERHRAHSHRTIEYWILRGFSEAEARIKVAKVQCSFSLEKCIQKYGETIGKQIWSNRQEIWLKSLKKSGLHGGFSKISLELFDSLNLMYNEELSYGNSETILRIDDMSYSIDCMKLNSTHIIEFYGDYWHANPTKFKESDIIKKKTARHIWDHDAKKIAALTNAGFNVLVIWESDYIKDKQGTIDKCNAFLKQ